MKGVCLEEQLGIIHHIIFVETDVYTRIPISGFTIRSNFHMHMHLQVKRLGHPLSVCRKQTYNQQSACWQEIEKYK